jgi:hypothetical protein
MEQQQISRARHLLMEAVQLDQGVQSLLEYAALLHQLGEEIQAIEQLSIAWNIARREQQFLGIAAACDRLAVIHRDRGEWAIAKSFQQQAVSARFRSGNPLLAGDFMALANDAIIQRDLDHAEELAIRALVCSESSECRADEADAWGVQGTIALLRRQPRVAWRCFLRAYFLHCRARDPLGRLMDLLNLAAASREKGEWEMTERLLVKANSLAHRLGTPRLIQRANRDLQEARRVLEVASRTPEWN